MTSAMRTAGLLLLGLLIAASGIWGALSLAYTGPGEASLRTALACALAAASLLAMMALASRRWRWRAALGYAVLFGALLGWWSGIEPSNDRDWQTDVAVLPCATIDGDLITVHNIRNFDYRSETDYTPAYYDKHFDLRQLEGVDLVAVYWMGPAIAHIFLSFGFAGGDHLADFHRDAQGKGRGLFHDQGLLPPIRTLLRGGRRTRRHPAAHQLPP